ncbi:MAG TPA: hypothetical protein VIS49_03600 [Cyclobacteriaceae bacterium]
MANTESKNSLFLLRSFVFLFGLFFCDYQASAQNPIRTIDISDAFESALINAENNEEIEFDNYKVQFTKLSGKDLFNYLANKYPERVNKQGRIEFLKSLTFSNCFFEKSLELDKFIFKTLRLTDCSSDNQRYSNCQFESLMLEGNKISNSLELTSSYMAALGIKGNTVGYEMYLEQDSIVGGDSFIENNVVANSEIVISGAYFNGSVIVGNNHVSGILIENSNFDFPEYGEFNNYKISENASSDLYLKSNKFHGDNTSKVYFNKGNYLNLDLRDNYFGVNVYFIENKAEERFFMVDNEFTGHVSFEKFLFSETWNELYWEQLAGYKLRFAEYGGQTDEELEDEIRFSNLVNIYKGLHTIFLSRGDIESANACYSEMKQLQGRKLKHVFQLNKTFGNFLRWQLNVLLKIYTNHGTDPALAVVMSFFVILMFAVLYLFFPSEWDTESTNRLLISYEQFLQRKKRANVAPLLVVFGSLLLTLINSITLSINSFVTLGFGSIPTKGFARYLCIIEGFIGWFLLSIFTVALINQVLA